jgi:hypothetical protein
MTQFGTDLTYHTEITVNTLVDGMGGKDGQLVIMAQAAHTLDMVGMIMRNQDAMHLVDVQSVVTKILLQRTDAYAGINNETIRLCV